MGEGRVHCRINFILENNGVAHYDDLLLLTGRFKRSPGTEAGCGRERHSVYLDRNIIAAPAYAHHIASDRGLRTSGFRYSCRI